MKTWRVHGKQGSVGRWTVCVCVCVCVCVGVSGWHIAGRGIKSWNVWLMGWGIKSWCACHYWGGASNYGLRAIGGVRALNYMFVEGGFCWPPSVQMQQSSWQCKVPRFGQNRMYTPYLTVCLVISLSKIPFIHRIYIWFWPTLKVLKVPTFTATLSFFLLWLMSHHSGWQPWLHGRPWCVPKTN